MQADKAAGERKMATRLQQHAFAECHPPVVKTMISTSRTVNASPYSSSSGGGAPVRVPGAAFQ
jgi:hypothetical protein